MPTDATATYKGIAGFSDVPGPFVPGEATDLAEIELRADFGASTISGSLTNFRFEEGDGASVAVPGTVNIAETSIAGNSYASTLSGSVIADGSSLAVTGNIDGTFIGAEAAAIAGGINVNMDDFALSGIYIAER